MTSKLEAALAAILSAPSRGSCWASRLDGDARKLVERLKEEEAKGTKISRTATQKVLREVFDVRASEEMVRAHLKGLCSCR